MESIKKPKLNINTGYKTLNSLRAAAISTIILLTSGCIEKVMPIHEGCEMDPLGCVAGEIAGTVVAGELAGEIAGTEVAGELAGEIAGTEVAGEFAGELAGTEVAGEMAGDSGQSDSDGDGVTDDTDNCISIPNSNQEDNNQNGIGDACEPNTDIEDFVCDNGWCVQSCSDHEEIRPFFERVDFPRADYLAGESKNIMCYDVCNVDEARTGEFADEFISKLVDINAPNVKWFAGNEEIEMPVEMSFDNGECRRISAVAQISGEQVPIINDWGTDSFSEKLLLSDFNKPMSAFVAMNDLTDKIYWTGYHRPGRTTVALQTINSVCHGPILISGTCSIDTEFSGLGLDVSTPVEANQEFIIAYPPVGYYMNEYIYIYHQGTNNEQGQAGVCYLHLNLLESDADVPFYQLLDESVMELTVPGEFSHGDLNPIGSQPEVNVSLALEE